jgi:hypothetical protein
MDLLSDPLLRALRVLRGCNLHPLCALCDLGGVIFRLRLSA